uniref:Pancreatic trypsin inhibitor n=1 Tax=Rhipicephalus zambeziensis TaxID=60191 RepID=A0A224YQW8_9ACAR
MKTFRRNVLLFFGLCFLAWYMERACALPAPRDKAENEIHYPLHLGCEHDKGRPSKTGSPKQQDRNRRIISDWGPVIGGPPGYPDVIWYKKK